MWLEECSLALHLDGCNCAGDNTQPPAVSAMWFAELATLDNPVGTSRVLLTLYDHRIQTLSAASVSVETLPEDLLSWGASGSERTRVYWYGSEILMISS